MVTPEEILAYWLDDVGPKGWYESSPELDADIRERFESTWDGAMAGKHVVWLTHAPGTLAYLILTDQFPRNMFRGDAKAFRSDRIALAAAKSGISKGYDLKTDPPARQFFYLPLMHSENLCDQDRCVRLIAERMPEAGNSLLHAQAHREIIRKFGRFPYRNEALSRRDTAPEKAFMSGGGYAGTLQELKKAS